MQFNNTLFKEILALIESNVSFSTNGVEKPQCFDFKCYINMDELFKSMNRTSERCNIEEFKYCLALLRQFGYIETSNGSIDRITPSGFKFILSQLHNIECKY